MNLKKTTGLVALAFTIVALFGGEAAAQAPTLTVTTNGPSVTITWTEVPGALGYTIQAATRSGAADIASVNLPTSITRIVIKAPAGTYFLRVRAFAGGISGPFSNEVELTVGATAPPPPGCQQPAGAPSLTANVAGLAVTLNWAAVDGATSYEIQWSRYAGGTELVEHTAATSQYKYVGVTGTFYARVKAHNACGSTTSAEVSFTIGSSTPPPGGGGGQRTPNPPPGQLLPVPSYAPAVIDDMARRYPGQLSRSCKTNHEWLFLLLRELRTRDTRWGLNWKRGDARQGMSSDIISYNPTDQPDEGNGQVYIFDVIGAECEGNYPTFNDVTQHTWAFRGDPACGGGTYCTKWTLQPYLQAGFPADTK